MVETSVEDFGDLYGDTQGDRRRTYWHHQKFGSAIIPEVLSGRLTPRASDIRELIKTINALRRKGLPAEPAEQTQGLDPKL